MGPGASGVKVISQSPSWRGVQTAGAEAVRRTAPGASAASRVNRPGRVASSSAVRPVWSGYQDARRTKVSKPVVRVPGR